MTGEKRKEEERRQMETNYRRAKSVLAPNR
jgi:hypothetical protein